MKTYQGSCHCGAIRFEADIDPRCGTVRCNCTYCLKIRCWATLVAPTAFRLLSGAAALTEYQFGSKHEYHCFCQRCGARPFGRGNSPRFGAFYGVSVTCLDDASLEDFAEAPIRYIDGRNDNWDTPPTSTRLL